MNDFLRDCIDTILLPAGFKRKSKVYSCSDDEVSHIIEMKSSKWTGSSLSFTIEIGVFISKASPFMGGLHEGKAPTIEDCYLRCRIGMLLEQPHDTWWSLDSVLGINPVCNEVRDCLNNLALPLLDSLKSIIQVRNFIESWVDHMPKDRLRVISPTSDAAALVYIAVLYHVSGNNLLVNTYLSKAREKSAKPYLETINYTSSLLLG